MVEETRALRENLPQITDNFFHITLQKTQTSTHAGIKLTSFSGDRQ